MDQNNPQTPPAETPSSVTPSTPVDTVKTTEPSATPPTMTPATSPVTPEPAPVEAPTAADPTTPMNAATAESPTVQAPAAKEHPDAPSSSSLGSKSNNKKTIAVAAAGVSMILVILGVFAMTRDGFTTQTKQEAAAPAKQVANNVPSLTPTPSDVVEQDLGSVSTDLKSVDQEASMADQGLSATPADLQ